MQPGIHSMRGVFIVLITLALLLAAEGAARVAEWIRPADADLRFEYAPYRMLKMSRAPWPLNRDGFRARELETYRDGFLIEFLGGSVCVGVGTDPGATVSERLEAALHQAGLAKAQVLDLCQGGATSAQELAIFLEYGLPLRPRMVLSFDGANDVLHPRPVGEDEGANLPYRNAALRARVNGGGVLEHVALARVAARLAARWSSPRPPAGAPVAEGEITRSYLYALSIVRTLTRAQGGDYALILQPTLHGDKPWSAEESAMWSARWGRRGPGLSREIARRYAATRSAAAAWAEQSETPFYDLTRVFAHTGLPVYSDSVHFRGTRGYAMLFDELTRQGLIERLAQRYREWEP